METVIAFHEVDDVEHWVASEKRNEFFEQYGMSARAFKDPEGSNRVGVLIETPDMETLEKALQGEAAQEAMKHDGVRPETILMLVEG